MTASGSKQTLDRSKPYWLRAHPWTTKIDRKKRCACYVDQLAKSRKSAPFHFNLVENMFGLPVCNLLRQTFWLPWQLLWVWTWTRFPSSFPFQRISSSRPTTYVSIIAYVDELSSSSSWGVTICEQNTNHDIAGRNIPRNIECKKNPESEALKVDLFGASTTPNWAYM